MKFFFDFFVVGEFCLKLFEGKISNVFFPTFFIREGYFFQKNLFVRMTDFDGSILIFLTLFRNEVISDFFEKTFDNV